MFREVEGKCAYYFNATLLEDMAQAIAAWIVLYREMKQPKLENTPILTSKKSSELLY